MLYPLRTSAGTIVTRGFPLEPRAGERVDHPHHVGLWLNHGDVNGFDFWNNSDAIPAKDAAKYGTIVHRAIQSAKSGLDKGELQVTEDWRRRTARPSCARTRPTCSAAGPASAPSTASPP